MSKTESNPIANYEATLNQLESIVSAMERGELSLEEALAQYEAGIGLIRKCQQALDQAEQRIQMLSQVQAPQMHEQVSSSQSEARDDDLDLPF